MKEPINIKIGSYSFNINTDEDLNTVREAESLINLKWNELEGLSKVIDDYKKLYILLLEMTIEYLKLKKSSLLLTKEDEIDIINKVDVLYEKIKNDSLKDRI